MIHHSSLINIKETNKDHHAVKSPSWQTNLNARLLDNLNNEYYCIPNGYELSLGVHLFSTIFLAEGDRYGHGHLLDGNGNKLADFSLTYIPSSNSYDSD
jgi:hypothetical protein